MLRIEDLLKHMVERGASDLHICVGIPPELRIDGDLVHTDFEVVTPETSGNLVRSLLTKEQQEVFDREMELDFSYSIRGLSRFRINVYRQRGAAGLVARGIPYDVPPMEGLGIPDIIKEFSERQNGLFIVTGPVGAGKSTTLAAMIEYINNSRRSRIITVEDPIEYLFKHKKSTIDQREVGADTTSFRNALRHVFRQDPNIIFIGEMRDLDSMHIALTLAETGHLILTTLHTADTTHSISRIVDIFPPHQQNQVRLQLSMVLVGVISQKLIRRAQDKPGRVLATEVMNVTSSIRNLIRENDLPQIYSTIQTGKKYGMHTMNQSLVDLYRKSEITYERALQNSNNQEELLSLIASI
ncbi:MAG: type IV pilus twitching motility protein PilT [Candidatus Omnitrophica bacterium]|nr:type IV pilus twitching motility protein PilT [Candidatus Omnitrophota bacterium]